MTRGTMAVRWCVGAHLHPAVQALHVHPVADERPQPHIIVLLHELNVRDNRDGAAEVVLRALLLHAEGTVVGLLELVVQQL